jgi:hypothetical protein
MPQIFSNLIVFEHEESGDVGRASIDLEILLLDSVIEIVILTSPSVETVRKPIDFLEL